MSTLFEQVEELIPKLAVFASMKERVGISNQDHSVAGSR
jgi:hypothetical protein